VATQQLSELQLALVKALWEIGEGSVADVQAALEKHGRKLAPTTVATVLRRLEAQGWVTHREQGRHFIYRSALSRQRTAGRILGRITDSLFGGNVPALVSQLLETHKVDRREIEEIKRLIEARERKLR
jgi:BlaI family transcriptional regulator, penicillinase repressor